jgi:histidinol-phosphate phosphatase family protein
MKDFQVIDNRWTLFLDRDGVINRRKWNDYVKSVNEFFFLPGVLEAMKMFAQHFSRIIIVTNQQGIGKGLYTEESLSEIHEFMCNEIKSNGGRIDAVYFCSYLKEEGHPDRKPEIGMALRAKNDFPEIDFTKSIMAGDTQSDIDFGINAGMKTVQIGAYSEDLIGAGFRFDSLLHMANAFFLPR